MLRPPDPIYRHVLRDAFAAAWQSRRAWPVALIAGILLSGSVYDVLWKLMNALAPQVTVTSIVGSFSHRAFSTWSGFSLTDLILGGVQVLQLTALFLILGFAVVGLSVICQGALVAFLGARGNGKGMRVRQAITVGARAFWPILVLNGLALLVLWTTKTLLTVLLAFSASAGTAVGFLLFLFGFIIFGIVAIAAVVIQIFALHAMILQGATLMQALERAGRLLQAHWIIVVETTALLFMISLGMGLLLTVGILLLLIPLFLVLLTGSLLGIMAALDIVLYVISGMVIALLLAMCGYLIVLQYATWTGLYHRLGEGGPLPKIHRWYRQLVHGFHVPGS